MTDPSWLAPLLFIIAAFFFLLAAVTAAGGRVFRADAKAWFYGGLSSAAFGLAAS
jgi:hypothetical protein